MTGRWPFLLAPLIVWAAHFLLLYALGEWAGETPAVRVAIVASTMLALAADALVARRAGRIPSDAAFDRWRRSTIRVGALISAIAVVWQTLPAVL